MTKINFRVTSIVRMLFILGICFTFTACPKNEDSIADLEAQVSQLDQDNTDLYSRVENLEDKFNAALRVIERHEAKYRADSIERVDVAREARPFTQKIEEDYLDNLNHDYWNAIAAESNASFPDTTLAQLLLDSFHIANPNMILSVWVDAYSKNPGSERVNKYRARSGMVPGSTKPWGELSINYFTSQLKRLVMNELVKTRIGQNVGYNWAAPEMLDSFAMKDDALQALDLLTIEKTRRYLNTFNYAQEVKRSANDDFISTNPSGQWDYDAEHYAFCFRRIHEFNTKTDGGVSLVDAKYWANKSYTDAFARASPVARSLFSSWKGELNRVKPEDSAPVRYFGETK